jgi:hypothetical protein
MLLIFTVLKIISPIFFLGIIGYFWGKTKIEYPMRFVTNLTMNIALPCLVFTSLMNTQIETNLLSSIVFATLISYILLALICFSFVKLMKFDIPTFLPPMIFGNTGNLGLPLAFFAFGNDGLSYAIIIFAIMIILSLTLGIWIISGDKNLTKLFKEPIVWCAVLGAICLYFNIKTPIFITNSLELTGQIAIPIMLITLGVSVARLKLTNLTRGFSIVCFRTFICLLFSISVALALNLPEVAAAVLILQLTTPIAVTSYLLSEKFNRNPNDVASVVIISTLMSVFYIPIILSFLI